MFLISGKKDTKKQRLTLSLRRCRWMTGRSTVILEEGRMTGSFIKVYCKSNKDRSKYRCYLSLVNLGATWFDFWVKKAILTWIGSRNSSGMSPRAASASIASEAAILAFAPRSMNSCMILISSPILLRTSAAALNIWCKSNLLHQAQSEKWI